MTKVIKQKGFIYGAVVLGISMIVVKLIGALFKIPLLNILGESGMAYFSSAYTIFTTVYAFAVTGLTTAIARIIAEKKAQGRYRDIKKTAKISFYIFSIFGIASSILLLLCANPLAGLINSPKSGASIMVIAPAVLLCCIMASYRGYYEGLNNMIPTAISQIVEALVKLGAGLFFSYISLVLAQRSFEQYGTSFGVAVDSLEQAYFTAVPYAAAGAMLGITLSTLVGVIYLFIYHRVSKNKITPLMLSQSPVASSYKSTMVNILKVALPITACAVAMQLSSLIDMVTIMNRLEVAAQRSPEYFASQFGNFLSGEETYHEFLFGIYAAAVTLFNLVPAFTGLIGKSSIPIVTKAWAEHDIVGLRQKIVDIVKTTMFVSAPCGIGLCALSMPILLLLFGKLDGAVQIGAMPLAILGIAGVLFSLIGPLNSIFQSIGDVYSPVKVILLSSIIKVILNYLLVANPRLNITGCAIATLVSYLFAVIYSLIILSRSRVHSGIKIERLKIGKNLNPIAVFLYPILGGIACGVTAFYMNIWLKQMFSNTISVGIGIASGAVIYILFMISCGFFKKNMFLLTNSEKN